ncbi:hypothetical protein HAX54_003432 [Datura stramonium]|uniref:Uncharacterized protein n=1 Tax=Datura stramonium TaxID=4076 RepID=A0ABS8T6L0_DATST|nr:hypothetical protein [Datura stramonium]
MHCFFCSKQGLKSLSSNRRLPSKKKKCTRLLMDFNKQVGDEGPETATPRETQVPAESEVPMKQDANAMAHVDCRPQRLASLPAASAFF